MRSGSTPGNASSLASTGVQPAPTRGSTRRSSVRPSSSTQDPRQDEKELREYQKRDEFWIVTVLAASASAALLFGYAS